MDRLIPSCHIRHMAHCKWHMISNCGYSSGIETAQTRMIGNTALCKKEKTLKRVGCYGMVVGDGGSECQVLVYHMRHFKMARWGGVGKGGGVPRGALPSEMV